MRQMRKRYAVRFGAKSDTWKDSMDAFESAVLLHELEREYPDVKFWRYVYPALLVGAW